jgi:hypothetical protein
LTRAFIFTSSVLQVQGNEHTLMPFVDSSLKARSQY